MQKKLSQLPANAWKQNVLITMAANKTWDVFPSVNVNNIVYENQFKRSYREVVIFLFFETKHIEI